MGKVKASLTESKKYYPADDIPKPKGHAKVTKPNPTKLKKGIKPGQILILLAGRFQGKRVVFLKQLESGLLLVSGPYCCNGVPLRRVNQAYTIATSTQVDISGVNTSKFTDAYFNWKTGKKEDKLFDVERTATEVSDERKNDQGTVDDQLMKKIGGTPLLCDYLKTKFTLSKSDKPHLMKF